MAEDKFAPKAEDTAEAIHKLHTDLIKSQQEENKKAREHANKKVEPAKPEEPKAKEANPTQPPAVQSPQNPEAPQNKPVEQDKPQ